MLQNLKKKQEGFTIIEVMIVLVIAAVILLIVFLAVPALQRNSRNTQKKNIAADILSAASEFSSNNNGCVPGSGSCGTSSANATSILGLVNTNDIITSLSIQAASGTAGTAVTVSPAPSLSNAILVTNATCNGNTANVGSTSRQIALVYQVEGSGGSGTTVCTASGL